MELQLQHASSTDKSDMTNVFVQAFLLDRVTRLKAARHQDQAAYIGSLIESPLISWLSRPDRYLVVKADVAKPLRTVGWVC